VKFFVNGVEYIDRRSYRLLIGDKSATDACLDNAIFIVNFRAGLSDQAIHFKTTNRRKAISGTKFFKRNKLEYFKCF